MKPIKMNKEEIKKQLSDLMASYRSEPFSKTQRFELRQLHYAPVTNKPTIYFSDIAATKIREIVKLAKGEVAWHGFVERKEDTFNIYDIAVYPQKANPAFVTSADVDYITWMNSIPDEEFNNMRMQGHSHVNMQVQPSATDLGYYNKMLDQITDYYIFMIVNKRNDINLWLVDKENNLVYHKEDIISDWSKVGYDGWAKDAMLVVRAHGNNEEKTKPTKPAKLTTDGVLLKELLDVYGVNYKHYELKLTEAMNKYHIDISDVEEMLDLLPHFNDDIDETISFYMGGFTNVKR